MSAQTAGFDSSSFQGMLPTEACTQKRDRKIVKSRRKAAEVLHMY